MARQKGQNDPLGLFHPVIARWFREEVGEPTLPQKLGWEVIARGENLLLAAPTGSGKTLAAFLVGIDALYKTLLEDASDPGLTILYVSPLKALNVDIEKNLRHPLEGISALSKEMGQPVPKIRTAVRTGDTPTDERSRMVKYPPNVLITTPESLNIMLTSGARKIFKTVRKVIVDEIHSLAPNKRGTFLAILLERLELETEHPVQRIGLSATVRPMDQVGQYLVGYDDSGNPRAVTLVDAGVRKDMRIEIRVPAEDMSDLPGDSIWNALVPEFLREIDDHRSTILFANNRGAVERLATKLNEARAGQEFPAFADGQFFQSDRSVSDHHLRLPLQKQVKAHHGSVSKEIRLALENALKNGELKALVATATLELGIDMGAVDLVIQLESPHSVARGLQRVGRAGHLMTSTSVGYLYPKHRLDLVEMAVVGKGMMDGNVAPVAIPQNPLDMLAQQIVAMVAVEPWKVDDLYEFFRRAYPYRSLGRDGFQATVQMVAGQFGEGKLRDLRAKVFLDPISQTLRALPQSRRLAILEGGAIIDSGEFQVTIRDSGVNIGKWHEELIHETRVGDVVWLGSSTWRVLEITKDRVEVAPAPGRQGRLPFWKGEGLGRELQLGKDMGEFLRQADDFLISRGGAKRLSQWLRDEYSFLGDTARSNLVTYLETQSQRSAIPHASRIVAERFRDQVGEPQLAILTTLGRKVHLPLKIIIASWFHRHHHVDLEILENDDGLLVRFPEGHEALEPDFLRHIDPSAAIEMLIDELPTSAVFGLKFRTAASRALVIAGYKPGRRTPQWLQRMRARDLLQAVREFDDFPLILEAYRECLEDVMDVEETRKLLEGISTGAVEVATVINDVPSPMVSTLTFDFKGVNVYQWDEPKGKTRRAISDRERRTLAGILSGEELRAELSKDVVKDEHDRLSRQGIYAASTLEAFYENLRHRGLIPLTDIKTCYRGDWETLVQRMADDGLALIADARAVDFRAVVGAEDWEIPTDRTTLHFLIWAEYRGILASAWKNRDPASCGIVLRWGLDSHPLVSIDELSTGTSLPIVVVKRFLSESIAKGDVVAVEQPDATGQPTIRYGLTRHVERLWRLSHRARLTQFPPIEASRYAAFLQDYRGLGKTGSKDTEKRLREVLTQLVGLFLPWRSWESSVLPLRIPDYRSSLLDQLLLTGEFFWVGREGEELAFFRRQDWEYLKYIFNIHRSGHSTLTDHESSVIRALQQRGALLKAELAMQAELPSDVLDRVLWSLIWKGVVSNDGFQTIRSGKPKPRLSGRDRRPNVASVALSPWIAGRWFVIDYPSADQGIPEEALFLWIRQLLQRYGIAWSLMLEDLRLVGKDMDAEPLDRQLWNAAERMVLRGEIQDGYFVKGAAGRQHALPTALQKIKSRRDSSKLIVLPSTDPANPYGAEPYLSLPEPLRIGNYRSLNSYLFLSAGNPIGRYDHGTHRLNLATSATNDIRGIAACLHDSPLIKHPVIKEIDHHPAHTSPLKNLFLSAGFREGYRELVKQG